MKKKGIFITFEGGDGAGKTTLIEKVFKDLQTHSRDVVKTRAPGGTDIGKEIRSLLLSKREQAPSKRCELLLFLADRAQHVDALILPALNQGKIVLCDRFNDSTVAYQGSRGFKQKFVSDLCELACDGLRPDLTFYLDIDPKIGLERARRTKNANDRIESETLKFHQTIRKAFKQIAKKEPKRFIILDASQTPEEVFEKAKVSIYALLKARRK